MSNKAHFNRDRSLFMRRVGEKIMGVGQAYFFREKGRTKREFHDVLGWVVTDNLVSTFNLLMIIDFT